MTCLRKSLPLPHLESARPPFHHDHDGHANDSRQCRFFTAFRAARSPSSRCCYGEDYPEHASPHRHHQRPHVSDSSPSSHQKRRHPHSTSLGSTYPRVGGRAKPRISQRAVALLPVSDSNWSDSVFAPSPRVLAWSDSEIDDGIARAWGLWISGLDARKAMRIA